MKKKTSIQLRAVLDGGTAQVSQDGSYCLKKGGSRHKKDILLTNL